MDQKDRVLGIPVLSGKRTGMAGDRLVDRKEIKYVLTHAAVITCSMLLLFYSMRRNAEMFFKGTGEMGYMLIPCKISHLRYGLPHHQ